MAVETDSDTGAAKVDWRRLVGGGLLFAVLLVVGGAWALASHPGSSPDDNFHVPSIWCAWGPSDEECVALDEAASGRIPVEVPDLRESMSDCMVFDPTISAACIDDDPPGDPYPPSANAGLYPNGYYAVARLLVGSDPERSLVAIRFMTFLVCGLLFVASGLVVAATERWAVWWYALMLSVPLGLFFFASTNPTATSTAGTVATAAGSYAVGRQQGRPIVVSGAVLAFIGATFAVLSRGDGWQFAGLAVGLGALASIQSLRDAFKVERMLPWGLVVAWILLLVISPLTPGGSEVAGVNDGREVSTFSNLLSLPSMYVGDFATRLGWLDTPMPPLVWGLQALVIGGILILGLADLTRFRMAALAIAAVGLAVIPLLMLEITGYSVGQWVQPRYMLPLMLCLGFLLAVRPGRQTALQPAQATVLGVLSTTVHAAALHALMRRSITGTDVVSPDLGANAEWWWDIPVGPVPVWILGSAAFAVVMGVLCLQSVRRSSPSDPGRESGAGSAEQGRDEPDSVDTEAHG